MRQLLWFIALSGAIVTAVTALGAWLLLLPVPAGKALNEWYVIVPLADTPIKRLVFRVAGAVLMVVGAGYGMTSVWGAIRALFG